MSAPTSPDFETGTFAKYKALVFDCYGTLIDWETGIYAGLKPLFEQSGKPSDRRSVLEAFLSVEKDLQARHPTMLYPDLLAKLYTAIEARLQNKETPPDARRADDDTSSARTGPAEAFAQSVGTWAPFPDTIPALATLSKHFKLIILSNIDRATIAQTRRLMEVGGVAFDAVYTAEDAGAYKPAPEMLEYALAHLQDEFGIAQEEVLMTAQSVFHDIVPARGRGLGTAWINREGAVTGLEGVRGDEAMFVFSTLGAMAEAVEKTSS
ncbi:haloalkanoic acid dehalogenase [Earliella scabrosa]|nr:haloalkanoic acid dehalogenase [Earliella scabrosa]